MSIDGGLAKTRGGFLARLFGRAADQPVTPEWLDELEEALLRSDISVSLVDSVMLQVRDVVTDRKADTVPKVLAAVREALVAVLEPGDRALKAGAGTPRVILIVGVNGSGKTTTIGKLATALHKARKRVLLVAADTFRAAAAEQLTIWAERAGVEVVRGAEGSDPSAVVFDGMAAAKARNVDVVIVDTAGRLQTKTNLMEELKKMRRVIERETGAPPAETLLILDGTTGQNALSQARLFNEATQLTGVVVTKLDSTAKGGVLVAIVDQLTVPIKYVGLGEGADALQPFDPDAFTKALFEAAA
jgi:fused signal recognition particle receptor